MRPYVFRLSDDTYNLLLAMAESDKRDKSELIDLLVRREYVSRLQTKENRAKMQRAVTAIHAVAERNR